MIVVDTSVWVDHFNGYASDEASLLALCVAQARPIILSGLVLTETLQGVRNPGEAERVSLTLLAFELTPELDRSDYEQAAVIYRTCRAHGLTPPSAIDCLIAQLCLRYRFELLTRDRDFDAIAQLFPLKRLTPTPGVQEEASIYTSPAVSLARRRASAPRRSSRASAPRSRATRR